MGILRRNKGVSDCSSENVAPTILDSSSKPEGGAAGRRNPRISKKDRSVSTESSVVHAALTFKASWKEYCNSTAIHGVRYFVEEGRTRFERVFWVLSLAVSLLGCFYLILKVYNKWDSSPVIVSFAETSTPIWDVPFPAVSVCPETKSRQREFNYTDIFHRHNDYLMAMARNETATDIDDEERYKFEAVSLICDQHVFTEGNETVTEDTMDVLKEVAGAAHARGDLRVQVAGRHPCQLLLLQPLHARHVRRGAVLHVQHAEQRGAVHPGSRAVRREDGAAVRGLEPGDGLPGRRGPGDVPAARAGQRRQVGPVHSAARLQPGLRLPVPRPGARLQGAPAQPRGDSAHRPAVLPRPAQPGGGGGRQALHDDDLQRAAGLRALAPPVLLPVRAPPQVLQGVHAEELRAGVLHQLHDELVRLRRLLHAPVVGHPHLRLRQLQLPQERDRATGAARDHEGPGAQGGPRLFGRLPLPARLHLPGVRRADQPGRLQVGERLRRVPHQRQRGGRGNGHVPRVHLLQRHAVHHQPPERAVRPDRLPCQLRRPAGPVQRLQPHQPDRDRVLRHHPPVVQRAPRAPEAHPGHRRAGQPGQPGAGGPPGRREAAAAGAHRAGLRGNEGLACCVARPPYIYSSIVNYFVSFVSKGGLGALL